MAGVEECDVLDGGQYLWYAFRIRVWWWRAGVELDGADDLRTVRKEVSM